MIESLLYPSRTRYSQFGNKVFVQIPTLFSLPSVTELAQHTRQQCKLDARRNRSPSRRGRLTDVSTVSLTLIISLTYHGNGLPKRKSRRSRELALLLAQHTSQRCRSSGRRSQSRSRKDRLVLSVP